MERKIAWSSGYYDEIELVYEKAAQTGKAADILSELEEKALQEAEAACSSGLLSYKGKLLTKEDWASLPMNKKEQVIIGLGDIIGLEELDCKPDSAVVKLELSPLIPLTLGCTMFSVINRLEKLDGALNTIFPEVTLNILAPLGGKKDLFKCQIILMCLYPWLKIHEESSNYMAYSDWGEFKARSTYVMDLDTAWRREAETALHEESAEGLKSSSGLEQPEPDASDRNADQEKPKAKRKIHRKFILSVACCMAFGAVTVLVSTIQDPQKDVRLYVLTLMLAVVSGFLFWLSFREKKGSKSEASGGTGGSIAQNANVNDKADANPITEVKVSDQDAMPKPLSDYRIQGTSFIQASPLPEELRDRVLQLANSFFADQSPVLQQSLEDTANMKYIAMERLLQFLAAVDYFGFAYTSDYSFVDQIRCSPNELELEIDHRRMTCYDGGCGATEVWSKMVELKRINRDWQSICAQYSMSEEARQKMQPVFFYRGIIPGDNCPCVLGLNNDKSGYSIDQGFFLHNPFGLEGVYRLRMYLDEYYE